MMNLITLANSANSQLIDGIVMRSLKVNKDETGLLVETLRADWQDVYGNDRDFAMQYYSVTNPGVARDETVWHYHPSGQEDRFLVVSGAIVTAVADNRDGSPTKGVLNLFHMVSDTDPYMLLIPKKTLHGFLVVSKTPGILLNFPTRLYDPKEEGRIPYAEVAIKMEDGSPFSWNAVRRSFS